MSVLESRFSETANARFYTKDVDKLVAEEYKQLKSFIDTHRTDQRDRLKRLEQTYLGHNHGINEREERDEELADYRATHDFAKFITDFITGYVAGNPIIYKHINPKSQQEVDTFNGVNDIEGHDFNMIEDCSIYGRAYELIYRTEKDVDRVIRVSPFNAFMIYDNTLEMNELAGVVYLDDVDEDDKPITTITLYTSDKITTILNTEKGMFMQGEKPHHYEAIQLSEWQANRFRTGDFEHVLDLLDLYDMAQSDTANYMTDLNDALLKIEGDVELNKESAKEMKKARIILARSRKDAQGHSGSVNVDYIYKQYDVAGVEAYKKRLKQDIHMLTYTPDPTDDNFSGVQSGEAMKYKMTSLEQVRAKKERMFKASLKKRYRLLSAMLSKQNRGTMEDIQIEFTPNVPKTRKESIELFNSLGGTLSEYTKLTLLDFIDNPEDELKRIDDEQADDPAEDEYNALKPPTQPEEIEETEE